MINKWYQAYHRVLFGCSGEHNPSVALWVLWLTITIVRLVPATYSQWEDPLYSLVTKVNAPWLTTLGFNDNNGDHILYDAVSKIIIKVTRHHFLEFTYRIPSLVAGFLVMPLGFAVFSRIGGPVYGLMFGICAALLPAFTQHADNARGYMMLLFFTIWALGLTPGLSAGFRPIRLGLAYFLIGMSHGLGLLLLGCFAVFGCFTGPHRHGRTVLLANILLTIPSYLFNIPTIRFLFAFDRVIPRNNGALHSLQFFPSWIDYQFGSPLIPFVAIVFLGLIFAGAMVTFRQSWKTGISLVAFAGVIPAAFALSKNSWVLPQYSMVCMPFWLWAFFAGISAVNNRIFKSRNVKQWTVAGCCMLLMALVPSHAKFLLYPQQNYRAVFNEFKRTFPDQKTIFGFAEDYCTGLDYYARQNGLTYRVIDKSDCRADSAWQNSPVRCVIVILESDVQPQKLQWLKKNAVLLSTFKGTSLPVSLYRVLQVGGCP